MYLCTCTELAFTSKVLFARCFVTKTRLRYYIICSHNQISTNSDTAKTQLMIADVCVYMINLCKKIFKYVLKGAMEVRGKRGSCVRS